MPQTHTAQHVNSLLYNHTRSYAQNNFVLLQGHVSLLVKAGVPAFLVIVDGNEVIARVLAIMAARHEGWQRKHNRKGKREPFDPKKVTLPDVDRSGETQYLVGWGIGNMHVVQNFRHFRKIVSKDMAHMRHPATGVLSSYSLKDGLGHLQPLFIGWHLDTENFRSWLTTDRFCLKHVPGLDSKNVVLKGDGQKGLKKSHDAVFKETLLRACSRHLEEEHRQKGGAAGPLCVRLFVDV